MDEFNRQLLKWAAEIVGIAVAYWAVVLALAELVEAL